MGQLESKDNKFYKMRDLKIEMDQYYDKIINPKKEEDDEDEEVRKERNEDWKLFSLYRRIY